MPPLNIQYHRELREQYSYTPTWIPILAVRLGDVGRLTGNGYERVASLANFDIDFDVRDDPSTGHLRYESKGAVMWQTKAAGEAPVEGSVLAQAEAGVLLSFGRENAVFFEASGCVTASIDNQVTLGGEILERYQKQAWPKDHVVVTEVIRARHATVLISSSANAKAEFNVAANVSLADVSLTDVDAGIKLAGSRHVGTQIVAEASLTPLFKAKGVCKPLFRPPDFKRRGRHRSPAPVFSELSYDSFR